MTSNIHAEGILGQPALLLPVDGEPSEIANGYIELERVQRLAGRWVIQEYRFAVATWYELLTHYRRALDGKTPPFGQFRRRETRNTQPRPLFL